MTMIAVVAVGWTVHHFLYRRIAEFIRDSSLYLRAAYLLAF